MSGIRLLGRARPSNYSGRLRLFAILFLAVTIAPQPRLQAQPLGLGNDRSHPELRWMEFQTEHFILVYPHHLYETAVRAATVAEQVYEPITRDLETPLPYKTSILLSDEDEIVNGFAYPGKMFLWVHQNDFAHRFSGNDKWLRKVVAHEFQHNVWFEAAMDWTGLFGLVGTPSWFIEGLAEYHTEEWGPYRSDLAVRHAILRNQHTSLDPHDQGFSKVRYLAEQYGDSVIVKSVKKRNWLGVSDFDGGFHKATGVTVKQFDEEWRRVATGHTYALYTQKEEVTEVGDHFKLPGQGHRALTFSPNGEWIAVLVRRSRLDPAVLAVVRNDSTQTWREIDHGVIDEDCGFDSSGSRLVYAKRHRSTHGSILWDLKVADLSAGSTHWITSGRRASHPHWSPVADRIVFTASDGPTTNLYLCDPDGANVASLTQHPEDVQVLSPRFSPNGHRIAFSLFEPGRGIDLAVLDLETRNLRYVTQHRAYDLHPMWSTDGASLFFTSDRSRDEVPNLFVVPADGSEMDVRCLSDVGEALFGMDVNPKSQQVIARALASTDTSRVRSIDPRRRVEIVDPAIRPRFVSWRDRPAPNPIPAIDFDAAPKMTAPRSYRAWRHLRVLQWWAIPSPNPWGVDLGGIWNDIAHRNRIVAGVGAGSKDDRFAVRGAYLGWETNRLPLGASGTLSLSGGIQARTGALVYANDGLFDLQDFLHASWRLPLNFGEHDYANHSAELFFDFAEVEVQDRDDIDASALLRKNLPAPLLDYSRTTLGFIYRYAKSRPHVRRFGHATNGQGFWLRGEFVSRAFDTDLEFQRLSFDASKIVGPLFARVRAQSVWGSPAPQDFTGLRSDVPILPQSYLSEVSFLSDIIDVEETFFLRGFPRNVVGDQATLTTVELRVPLVPPLPVSAFGFSPGGLTGVVFYDHGRVWADGSKRVARHGVGWEARLPLRLGQDVLLVPSYGQGQTLDWERNGAPFTRDEYFRIAMTQPF